MALIDCSVGGDALALKENVGLVFSVMLSKVPEGELKEELESYRSIILKAHNLAVESKVKEALNTLFLGLYSFDTDALRRDVTKLVVLDDQLGDISKEEGRNLLRVLWKAIQVLVPDSDYTFLFNDWVSRSIWRNMPDGDN